MGPTKNSRQGRCQPAQNILLDKYRAIYVSIPGTTGIFVGMVGGDVP